MKISKDKLKSIGLFLLIVALAVIEFGLDLRRAGGGSKNAFMLFLVLAVAELFRTVKRAAKNTKNEQPEQKFEFKSEEETPEEPEQTRQHDPLAQATVSALGGLDWMLHKINPDYDPEAERNARNADPAAIAKLDEMKNAGLIDEKEYRKRKAELAGK